MRNLRSNRKRQLQTPDHKASVDTIALPQHRHPSLPAVKRRKLQPQISSSTPAQCKTRLASVSPNRINAEAEAGISLEDRITTWLRDIEPEGRGGEEPPYCEAAAYGTPTRNMPGSGTSSMPPPPTPPLTSQNSRIEKAAAPRAGRVRGRLRGRPRGRPRGRGRGRSQSVGAGSSVSSDINEDVVSTLSMQQSSVSRSSSRSQRGRTHDPLYYQTVLYQNHIEIIHPWRSHKPPHITDHLSKIQTPHPSPDLSQDFVEEFVNGLYELQNSADEADLSEFMTNLLPSTSLSLSQWLGSISSGDELGAYLKSTTGLAHSSQGFLCRHMVPPDVATPRPDRIYGYSHQAQDAAFSETQLKTQLRLKDNTGNALSIANNKGLRFPFFTIELKGQGQNWVAANQIGGGCFACLRSVHAINRALEKSRQKISASSLRQRQSQGLQHPPQELGVDNLVYGLTADNITARLRVAWYLEDSEGEISGCKVLQVEEFLLSRAQELQSLWARIRHILDWGKGRRLAQIRQALDILEASNFGV